jgi:glutamate/tyrosine decarboxylase-like PLP-dependent enzyme
MTEPNTKSDRAAAKPAESACETPFETPFETLDPADWDAMRALAHRMVDDALDYVRDARDRPAWRPVPGEVAERLTAAAPAQPSTPDAVYEEFRRDIQPYPMHTTHPRFWSWYMGSGTVMGALADLWAATLNPNLGGGRHVAPLVEKQVIDWIRDMVGFPAASSGLLNSGASMANFTALTVARNANCGYDVRRQGVAAAPGPLTVYASTEIHSCNQKAVETLGLGSAGLRRVAVDREYRLDLAALERQVAADRAEGCVPFCVIATAGTINTGAIDDLNAIADFCEREGLWFHVDGAIGAVAVLADNVRGQLGGMERADSIALDLHKWMHIPFEAGCVLVRDAAAHRDAFALVPEYLEREDEGRGLAAGSLWFSDYGLQLSRSFRALKVWMSIKEHGLERFGRMIARNVEQARHLGRLVEAAADLELMAPIGLDIVCFRFNPGGLDTEALNRLNQEILAELQEAGIAAPSYTTLHGAWCLRVAIANHRSRFEDFDLLVTETLRIGRALHEPITPFTS